MASVEDASLFSIALPEGGCKTRHNTSYTAKLFDCQAATNAGFFSFSGSCVGNSIVDGKVIAWTNPGNPAFGVLSNNTAIVGYVENPDDYHFKSMISGRGWLVRGGKQYIDESKDFKNPRNNSFVLLKAPRTAVGVKEDGSVFIAVVDGVELLNEGLDLYEWSEILIEKGAVQAINLDGGGSTDAFLNGNIWNLPNCDDKP